MSIPARTSRLPRRRLTRPDVVAAAAVVAERGVGELTMARVAAELDVTAMALYQYVSDKKQLLSLLLDSLLAGIEVPPRSAGGWEARLRQLHRDVTDAMTRYPGLVSAASDLDNVPRLLDGYLTILLEAGFEPGVAATAYTGLYYLAMGAQHPYHGPSGTPADRPPADPRHAASARVAEAAQGCTPRQLQHDVLDIYLAGLRSLRRTASRP